MKKSLVAIEWTKRDTIADETISDELSRILESSILESRLAERESIARDLHDTLLQGVQALLLKFHAVAERIPAQDPVRVDMEKALDYAGQVLTEGRDRLRNLRLSALWLTDLPMALQRLVDEMPQRGNAAVKILVNGTAQELDRMVLEESYLIGREALSNALLHSEAINLEVEITYTAKQFRLRVRDDGRGIDPRILAKGGRDDHWGLQGMRERASKIGGDLTIWSRPGSGTEVQLMVPTAIAYRTPAAKAS